MIMSSRLLCPEGRHNAPALFLRAVKRLDRTRAVIPRKEDDNAEKQP